MKKTITVDLITLIGHERFSNLLQVTYQGVLLSTWFITLDVGFHHLTEVVFARFLHCKLTPFSLLSILYSLEGSHYVWPTFNGQGFMLLFLEGGVIYMNYLELFCIGNFSLFHFIDSIICLYEYRLIDTYFILWVKSNAILFCYSNCPSFGDWELFQLSYIF